MSEKCKICIHLSKNIKFLVLTAEALKASITIRSHIFSFAQFNKPNKHLYNIHTHSIISRNNNKSNYNSSIPPHHMSASSTCHVSFLKTIPVNLHNQKLTVS